MKYLLDTNICIAILRGKDRELVSRLRAGTPEDFGLCSLVKAELLYGARKSQQVEANLLLLARFIAQFRSLAFDDRCAEVYGVLRVLLEKAGTPIGANDLCIASIALAHDLTLLTRNRDEFRRVAGLRWENW